jgi:hypothetical protein
MSSTNKTSLGLNMWEASDKPVRQDFVNDNVIIDEKVSKLEQNFSNENVIIDEKITKLNSNLTDFQDQYRKAIPLPDDTDINILINPGTYNVYTTIDGKKYRWIVVVDWCNASNVSLSRQTAYYYLGAGPMAPITRYQYNTGSGYAWSQWYYSNSDNMKITNITTGETNHTISFGYYSQGGKVYINVYVDGVAYGQIQPIS